jgi:hypothetical protein
MIAKMMAMQEYPTERIDWEDRVPREVKSRRRRGIGIVT